MTLHFLCPAPRQPAGGVEKIYQFVAALERAGMQAMVVHPDGSKPLAYWFEPAATVVRADQLDFDVDQMCWSYPNAGPSTFAFRTTPR